MRKMIAPVFIIFIILIEIFTTQFTFPNTYLSSINISGKNEKDLDQLFNSIYKKPLKIRVENRIYDYTYHDLGITLNKEKTKKIIFQSNHKIFPLNALSLFQSILTKQKYFPVLDFSPDFYQFVSFKEFEIGPSADTIKIDETDKKLSTQSIGGKYLIDANNLKTLILSQFGQENVLKPRTHQLPSKIQTIVESTNKKLSNVYANSASLLIEDGDNQTVTTLNPQTLKAITGLKYGLEKKGVSFDINEDNFKSVLNPILAPYNNRYPDKKVSMPQLKADLLSMLDLRLEGIDTNSIVAKIDYAPNTDGSLADKYLEIDISQQRIYIFEDGKLAKTYRISSGKYNPTPVGLFNIMNKALNAYSEIYRVYMPYWMAFYYSPELNAYFGIHELPYAVASDGTKKQRPRTFIGTPNTGGCVSLDINEAKEVYDFADIGTPVYIYE